MHQAGLVVWDVLNGLRERVRPGVTTLELEEFAASRAAEHKVRPAFKGYRGYPCVLCASVNQEVVHGIPSASRRLRGGRHHLAGFRRGVQGLLWRRGGDGSRRQDTARAGEAAARDAGVAGPRDRKGPAGQPPERYFGRRAGVGREGRVLRGARLRRARHRNQDARGAQRAELRRTGTRPAARGRHGFRDRAYGQRRRSGRESAGRPLDRGHHRWQRFGPFRAHRRGDLEGPLDFDPAARSGRTSW